MSSNPRHINNIVIIIEVLGKKCVLSTLIKSEKVKLAGAEMAFACLNALKLLYNFIYHGN